MRILYNIYIYKKTAIIMNYRRCLIFFQKDGFYGLAGNTTSGVMVQVKVSNILDPTLIVN